MRGIITLFFTAALIPNLAYADAHRDIKDIRHNEDVVRHQFLGWDHEGAAVFRAVTCGGAEAWTCQVALHRLDADGGEDVAVLLSLDESDASELEGDRSFPISSEAARQFVLDEAEALDEIGATRSGRTLPRPAKAFGKLAGNATEVHVRTIPEAADDGAVRLRLTVRGQDDVSIDLAELGDKPWRLGEHQILAAHRSPDGKAVAFAVRFVDGALGWNDEKIAFVRADIPAVRAELAHATGLLALAAGDPARAHQLFVLTTREDKSHVWGWYSRASVELSQGDVPTAVKHLARAFRLDPTQRLRACTDPALTFLTHTPQGIELLRCDSPTS